MKPMDIILGKIKVTNQNVPHKQQRVNYFLATELIWNVKVSTSLWGIPVQ